MGVKKKGLHEDVRKTRRRAKRPCRSAPQAPANVTLTFGKREVKEREEWRARVRWDPVTQDVAGRDITDRIDAYQTQLRATNASGNPVELDSGQPAVWKHLLRGDDDHDVYAPIVRPRTWYYQTRVRAGIRVAGTICWSAWSAWTTPVQPATGALPGPPVPTGQTLTFIRDESRKGSPWAAKQQWNEVPTWTPTDGDTLDGAARYVVQLAVSDDGGTTTKNVRRDSIEARDADSDTTAFRIWHHISRHYWYRSRVRAVDVYGRKGAWSAWTAWARPPKISGPVQNLVLKHPKPRLYVAKWDPPSDEDAVIGYRVRWYRQATLMETQRVDGCRASYHVPAEDKGKNHKVEVRALYDASVEESDDPVTSDPLTESETWERDSIGEYEITDTEMAWAGTSTLALLAESCAVASTNDQTGVPNTDTDTVVGFNTVEYSTPNFTPQLSNNWVILDARGPDNNGVYLVWGTVRFSADSTGRRRLTLQTSNDGTSWSNLYTVRVAAAPGAPTDVMLTWLGRLTVSPGNTRIRLVAGHTGSTSLTLLAAGKRLAVTYLGAPQFTSSPPSSGRPLGRRLP
jgi:hypothetical protein